MGKATKNLSIEQQEMLDSGLRMLAHMIAATHMSRISPNEASEDESSVAKWVEPPKPLRKIAERYSHDIQPENYHE